MEVRELMLGDILLATHDDGESVKKFPVKIDGLDENGTLVEGDSEMSWVPLNEKDKDEYYSDFLDPIPLTAEILVKNGWKEIIKKDKKATYNNISISYKYAGDCKHLHESIAYIEKAYDKIDDYRKDLIYGFRFSIKAYGGTRDTIFSKYISNVHELQHALRLCELDELADNFKIE